MAHYAVVTGTPNHMEVVHTAPAYPDAKRWALNELGNMRSMVAKFDRDRVTDIDDAIRKVKEASTPVRDKPTGVHFQYLGVTFQLQLKRLGS